MRAFISRVKYYRHLEPYRRAAHDITSTRIQIRQRHLPKYADHGHGRNVSSVSMDALTRIQILTAYVGDNTHMGLLSAMSTDGTV